MNWLIKKILQRRIKAAKKEYAKLMLENNVIVANAFLQLIKSYESSIYFLDTGH